MILFETKFKRLILDGIKTRTYRTGKKRWNEGATHQAKTDYSGKSHFADLVITSVQQRRVGSLTRYDATQDGFDSLSELREYLNLPNDALVWEIKFKAYEHIDASPFGISSDAGYDY